MGVNFVVVNLNDWDADSNLNFLAAFGAIRYDKIPFSTKTLNTRNEKSKKKKNTC